MSTLATTNIKHPSSASNNIVLDSSGGVVLQAGSASTPALQPSGDTNTGIFFPAADTIAFAEGGVEAMRIDSSSRLLVGTSTSVSTAQGFTPGLQVASTGALAALSVSRYVASASYCGLTIQKSRNATVGSHTVLQSGDGIGLFTFEGSDGTNFIEAASIAAVVDGTPGANDMPGRLVFSTTADGASSPTERLRIDKDGQVLLGDTSAHSHGIPALQVGGSAGNGLISIRRNSTTLSNQVQFWNPNGSVGNISTSGTSTAYNTSSDYRLKENVVPLTGAVDRLNQLQVHRFNFIADPDHIVDGFIAHEAQAVVPECVTGGKDAVDDEGNPVYQGIDQSKLVPLLTAALQEAIGRIETLEAEVAALKGA